MARASLLRRLVCLVALAACIPAVLAQSDSGWQSHKDYLEGRAKINGILLRQDIERSKKSGPSTLPPRSLPTTAYPIPLQSPGSGAITTLPNGDVQVARGIKGTGPGGLVIDVDVREVFPKRKIAQRIVEALPIVGSAVGGALLIKDLIDAARVMEGPGGTVVMDEGAPQVTDLMWRYHRSNSGAPYNNLNSGYVFRTEVQARDGALAHCEVQSGSSFCVVESDSSSVRWVGTYRCGSPSDGTTTDSCLQAHPGGPGYEGRYYYNIQSSSVLTCPEGQSISFWADDWCTTAPDTWPPVPVEEATDRVEQKIAPGAAPEILKELDGKDIGVGGDLPSVQGPSAIHTGRETTTNPDGSTTVKDTSSDIRYGPQEDNQGLQGPGWDWNTREEIRTYPPGEAIPPPGTDTTPPNGGGTVTENPGGSGLEDLITCGLPWTPACKIDETGTPEAPADTSGADAERVFEPALSCLEDLASCLPALPDLNWTFALPADCSVIQLPAFEAMAPGAASLDICQFQPVFHDVMSFFWSFAAVAAAIGMVFRDSVGGA